MNNTFLVFDNNAKFQGTITGSNIKNAAENLAKRLREKGFLHVEAENETVYFSARFHKNMPELGLYAMNDIKEGDNWSTHYYNIEPSEGWVI